MSLNPIDLSKISPSFPITSSNSLKADLSAVSSVAIPALNQQPSSTSQASLKSVSSQVMQAKDIQNSLNALAAVVTPPSPTPSAPMNANQATSLSPSQQTDAVTRQEEEAKTTQSLNETLGNLQSILTLIKGGSIPFQDLSKQGIAALGLIAQIVNLVTNVVDVGTGVGFVFYKMKILYGLKQQIDKELENQSLSDDLKQKFKTLQNQVKAEFKNLPSELIEQGFVFIKNAASTVLLVLSLPINIDININVSLVHLSFGLQGAGGGMNVLLAGILFYRAAKGYIQHVSWTKKFQEEHFTLPADLLNKRAERENIRAFKEKSIKEFIKNNCQLSLDDQKQKLKGIFPNTPEDRLTALIDANEDTFKIALDNCIEQEIPKMKEKLTPFYSQKIQEILENTPDEEACKAKLKELIPEEKLIEQLLKTYKEMNQAPKDTLKDKQKLFEKILTECAKSSVNQLSNDQVIAEHRIYQGTVEPILKGALKKMIQQKQEIEHGLIRYKLAQRGIVASMATVVFGITVALGLIAIFANPIGAAAGITMLLSGILIATTIGLLIGAYYLAYREKPQLTTLTLKAISLQIVGYKLLAVLASVKEKINNYANSTLQRAKDAIVSRLAQTTLNLASGPASAAPAAQIAPTISTPVAENVKKWQQKATELEEKVQHAAWNDFAKKAQLKHSEQSINETKLPETLQVFYEALLSCDLTHLDSDLKSLIEKQLGLNINTLQTALDKDPEEVKRLLRNFFNLNDESYISFVNQQLNLQAS